MRTGSLAALKPPGLEVGGQWLPVACVGLSKTGCSSILVQSYSILSEKVSDFFSIFSSPKGRFSHIC